MGNSQFEILSVDPPVRTRLRPHKLPAIVAPAFSKTARSTVLDSLPGFIMREMVWANKGHILAYVLDDGARPSRIRFADLDTGKHSILGDSSSRIVSVPDSEHIIVIGREGVERVSLVDGRRETTANLKNAESALYSRSGTWLGILSYTPSETATKGTPPSAAPDPAADASCDTG
jgi:hypothetical protein